MDMWKKRQAKKEITIKKKPWKKPAVVIITEKELNAYIIAAARSGGFCADAVAR